MKLTKQEVLDLIKVLTHYEVLTPATAPRVSCRTNIEVLQDALEDYILENEDEEKNEELTDDEDEDDIEDEETESEEESCEGDDEDDEEALGYEDSREEDDEDDSEDDEEEIVAEHDCKCSSLKGLCSVKAVIINAQYGEPEDKVSIQFSPYSRAIVDLNINDDGAIGPVTYIKRTADELHVADCNGSVTWHSFYVKKFPKSWTKAIKTGVSKLVK